MKHSYLAVEHFSTLQPRSYFSLHKYSKWANFYAVKCLLASKMFTFAHPILESNKNVNKLR